MFIISFILSLLIVKQFSALCMITLLPLIFVYPLIDTNSLISNSCVSNTAASTKTLFYTQINTAQKYDKEVITWLF